MYQKLLPFLFFFISFIAFSQKQKSSDLKISGDYTHQYTKTVFPKFWTGFTRETVRSYDSQNKNIGISYIQQTSKKSKTVISLYVYPFNEVDNHLLRDEFLSYQHALNQNSSIGIEMKPLFSKLSDDQFTVNSVYSVFKNSLGEPDFFKGVKYADKQSMLAIYECGGWRFKIRVTSDDMTAEQLQELKKKIEKYFDVLAIAAVKPLPVNDGSPDIIIYKPAQRDSMMVKAAVVAAQSKIEWMKNNLDTREFSTGFTDMNINSEIYSIEKMLEFYKLHKSDWKMTPDTEKYFNEMSRIADNNRLKDHIYEKYESVIDYPEGDAQKTSYIQFKIDKNISEDTNEILYKIFYRFE
jgi:hypothetical protein